MRLSNSLREDSYTLSVEGPKNHTQLLVIKNETVESSVGVAVRRSHDDWLLVNDSFDGRRGPLQLIEHLVSSDLSQHWVIPRMVGYLMPFVMSPFHYLWVHDCFDSHHEKSHPHSFRLQNI